MMVRKAIVDIEEPHFWSCAKQLLCAFTFFHFACCFFIVVAKKKNAGKRRKTHSGHSHNYVHAQRRWSRIYYGPFPLSSVDCAVAAVPISPPTHSPLPWLHRKVNLHSRSMNIPAVGNASLRSSTCSAVASNAGSSARIQCVSSEAVPSQAAAASSLSSY